MRAGRRALARTGELVPARAVQAPDLRPVDPHRPNLSHEVRSYSSKRRKFGSTRGVGCHEATRVRALATVTQTSPRNYPGSCSRREPKSPKADDVRSAKLRGVVC